MKFRHNAFAWFLSYVCFIFVDLCLSVAIEFSARWWLIIRGIGRRHRARVFLDEHRRVGQGIHLIGVLGVWKLQ
jgi:hypothetical protein